ncbi:hypothetical protein SRHO_G00212600 [Serrasalmus rhombeus]
MATAVCQAQHTQVSQEHEKLRSLLEKKAPETLDELKTKGTVTEKARIKLVKVCISDLVEKHGFYPTSTEKVALAKNIIPSLRVQVDGKGEGFEHFYDPDSHSGFLEMRLRNIRQKLEDAVPPAAVSSGQPAAADGGSEAERRPEQAHQHVADADVQQEEVDGGPEEVESSEEHQDQKVIHKPQNEDDPETNGHHTVTRPAQSGFRNRHGGDQRDARANLSLRP